ncbi:hypothetical protein DCAR_0521458 [Daucus carota subsp. sativus]|uniref:RING-type domain-containing protein n=1 Tax=Daucus carota subsp. sativus TaxID=79200 RepID=A0A164Z8H7_DAUCS|nr:PREDICTED: uncharacterized protein LOC108219879 isoform X2 [Daucus carota subsp. sativus]WOH02070.1 hypothetical protein DCAR_0521458 [Daucus carota subsp. sativus]
MAVAGLNNFSAISSSPLSKWCANHEKPCNQASLRQMWRELEAEHITGNSRAQVGVRSMQGSVIELNTEFTRTFLSTGGNHHGVNSLIDSNEKENEHIISPRRLQNENDDSTSSSSESVDFGKVERERVREVFREWQNNGLRNNTPRDSHPNNYSKAKWLHEQQCERVRIVREWVENTTQQRDRFHGGREGQDTETGAQIDRVREGLRRRKIRRLCGKQTLLDLVMRAENEREKELQDLLKHRHVSDFPYRNRIQSLLKGRFLRKKTYKQDEKPSSLAASELGILRQKQTVSDLREGFLSSKLKSFASGAGRSVLSDTSYYNDINCYRHEHAEPSCLQHFVPDELCSRPTSEETDTDICYTDDSECGVSEDLHQQESEALAGEGHVVLEEVDRQQLSSTAECKFWRTFASENSLRNSADGRSSDTLGSQEIRLSVTQGSDPQNNETDAPCVSGDVVQLEEAIIEDMNWQNIPPELEDWQDSVIEDGDVNWVQLRNGNYTGWEQTSEDGTETYSHASSQRQYQLHNDREHYNLQVPHEEWHDNALHESRNDWSNEHFSEEVAIVHTSHFSDDDNGQDLELRQLLSRRRVSNLLRSDFRACLDQVIQSYVERRDHAPVDWEVEGVSSSSAAVVEEEQEQPIGHLHMGHPEALLGTTLPTLIPPSQQISYSHIVQDHNAYQQQVNSLQQSRNDWEIINDLKVDMGRLHQRMNNIQMMLEACISMQLELQCSVKQELSAALNWQSRSADCENLVLDETNLEHVRIGVCCLCCDAKIDSLLYRCGHMCACSKCAQKLVEAKNKCPMCRAPVIEVISAYSIQ